MVPQPLTGMAAIGASLACSLPIVFGFLIPASYIVVATWKRVEIAGLPAVSAVGLSSWPDRDEAILVTEYLEFSIQYRRLLARFPLGPGPYRDRLLDAMVEGSGSRVCVARESSPGSRAGRCRRKPS